jgi:hypothetical protein
MRKAGILVLLLASLIVSASMALPGDAVRDNTTMLSLLRPGQAIDLERVSTGGYNIIFLSDAMLAELLKANPNFVPIRVTKVGQDYVMIRQRQMLPQTLLVYYSQAIAAHAIHSVMIP